jgi:hypothetical protein
VRLICKAPRVLSDRLSLPIHPPVYLLPVTVRVARVCVTFGLFCPHSHRPHL